METDSGFSQVGANMDMEASQANIIAEIQAERDDVKRELTTHQLLEKLAWTPIATNLKDMTDRVEQVEQRLADMEEWSTCA